jgi:two-component system, OmpR family, phosphate regulon sensor histidine kinase PhoR
VALFWRRVTVDEALGAVRRELAEPPAERSAALVELSRLLRSEQPDEETQDLIDRFPEAAGVLDSRGRFVYCNERLNQMLGRNCLERSVLEATRSGELEEAAQAALNGATVERELNLPSTQLQVRATFAPLARKRALVVLHDQTVARRMEAMRRDFIANASHELRTPVAAIAGAAETLLASEMHVDGEARRFVEMISRHADRLSRLTRDLLDLSKLEAGEYRAALGAVELGPLCEACLDLVRERALEKEVALGFDGPHELRALADRRALEQILVNLLDNAVKYTPQGGRVTLLADGAGPCVLLSVIDTGPGIEPRHQSRIFERFYRVDGGRSRDAGGTGLGLAIVKHLAIAQNGEVGVESGRGGSRFWVKLKASPTIPLLVTESPHSAR